MKFYALRIFYKGQHKEIKYISYPKGKKFLNFDKYFKQDKNIKKIMGYDQNNRHIYSEWYDREYTFYLYNEKGLIICERSYSGEIKYPHGKKVYNEYILEKKKEKFKKILKKAW